MVGIRIALLGGLVAGLFYVVDDVTGGAGWVWVATNIPLALFVIIGLVVAVAAAILVPEQLAVREFHVHLPDRVDHYHHVTVHHIHEGHPSVSGELGAAGRAPVYGAAWRGQGALDGDQSRMIDSSGTPRVVEGGTYQTGGGHALDRARRRG